MTRPYSTFVVCSSARYSSLSKNANNRRVCFSIIIVLLYRAIDYRVIFYERKNIRIARDGPRRFDENSCRRAKPIGKINNFVTNVEDGTRLIPVKRSGVIAVPRIFMQIVDRFASHFDGLERPTRTPQIVSTIRTTFAN